MTPFSRLQSYFASPEYRDEVLPKLRAQQPARDRYLAACEQAYAHHDAPQRLIAAWDVYQSEIAPA